MVYDMPETQLSVIAGTGCPGPTLNMLDHPHGIFVDGHFNLFVADTNNNRMQRFAIDQQVAVTFAGESGSTAGQLNSSHMMAFKIYENIFVADMNNGRIQRFSLSRSSCGKQKYEFHSSPSDPQRILTTMIYDSSPLMEEQVNQSMILGKCTVGYVTGRSGDRVNQLQFHWYYNN
ncbi:unnamed protein product [Adineta ricciae]|uniref:Uncharacterized protein n=1 Tax=Adineta ricciae TaxID=249248 RepID=A0A813S7Q2_ADIRI|nr:unnamed protein product [Adineta ricciae]